jgi:hypothetical protein
MSADIKSDNQPYDDINITPMLDLAYVLLVTFIILTTASVQGVRVDSPLTTAANSAAASSVARMRGVTFEYAADRGTVHVGLIAQEVAAVFPSLVTEIDGFQRVDPACSPQRRREGAEVSRAQEQRRREQRRHKAGRA